MIWESYCKSATDYGKETSQSNDKNEVMYA